MGAKRTRKQATGPAGGVRTTESAMHGWRWNGSAGTVSAPVRCRREQWYLVSATPAGGVNRQRAEVALRFFNHDEPLAERALWLHAVAECEHCPGLLGWVQSPDKATHVQLGLPGGPEGWCQEVTFHPVAERDPKCHPLAAVPRWRTYRPPFPIRQVFVPPALEALAEYLPGQEVTTLRPRSRAELKRRVQGAACVLDPEWAVRQKLTWADLEQIAADSWLMVDLETVWRLLRQTGGVTAQLVTQSAPHGIMSARVEYADVATRGFAMQDVFPYGTIDADGGFAARVLRADRAWKRYADREGFATLLASETPHAQHCGDVLTAAKPVGRGELIATDLPWLVAGTHGPLVAPRLARHALAMHLAGPLSDVLQYWNRWDDGQIMVRDIADLARRYPPLWAVRWASPKPEVVHLGIALPAATAGRTLLIRTGRVDNLHAHDGVPPEPMVIFMKMLARDAHEQTPWARRHLAGLNVVWQFDSSAGRRYAANYASAAALDGDRETTTLLVRCADGPADDTDPPAGRTLTERIDLDEGLHGDGSLACQRRLDARLRRRIEEVSD
ncbi:MAG: hypothetical protein PVJ57_07805 [Phycisphaerae bacterium]|jgi:hypothetical protein